MLITEVSFKIVPAPIFRLRLYLDFIKAQLCIDKNCGLFIGIVEPALVVFVTERTLKELWMNEQERRRCPKYIIYIYIVITTLEICTRTKYIYIYIHMMTLSTTFVSRCARISFESESTVKFRYSS